MKTLSTDVCIKTLRRMAETRWGAVQNEMAVSILFFASQKAATIESKGRLAELYSKAGYECLEPNGRDYQAIRARIGAGAKLFHKITTPVIQEWAGDDISGKMIVSVSEQIAKLNLCTLSDVLSYCADGKERAPRKSKHSEYIHVKTERLDFEVPPDISYDELIEAINRLTELAKNILAK